MIFDLIIFHKEVIALFCFPSSYTFQTLTESHLLLSLNGLFTCTCYIIWLDNLDNNSPSGSALKAQGPKSKNSHPALSEGINWSRRSSFVPPSPFTQSTSGLMTSTSHLSFRFSFFCYSSPRPLTGGCLCYTVALISEHGFLIPYFERCGVRE